MTDKQWQSIINRCLSAGRKHLLLLKIAYNEMRVGEVPLLET